ncbi:MAG TPA: serine hydrolase domain-containing protein [Dehalococcoidia bacterium]|nr:serine hydrolase domain-containing protein [Dehalococcoidia bacterium]
MTLALSAPNVAAVPGDLEAFIETERRRADVVGVAVAAFDREGVRFAGGLGYADLARGERVTPETVFRAASITKLFTTTLVLQEIEAGRIGLDDLVNPYLDPRTRILDRQGSPADDVAVRHLLTHTSGLPVSWRGLEYGPLPYRLLVNEGRSYRTLRDLVAGQSTVRAPDKRIVYSNGAFETLGYLVQRLNGRPYSDLLRERVLGPLGMVNSSLPIDPTGPGIATPYGGMMTGSAGRRPAGSVKVWARPAGALVASALDLSRFGQMVLRDGELDGRRLLSAATLKEATSYQARNHPELDEGFGLGFMVARYRGRPIVGHDGGLAGVSTRVAMLPEDGLGVAVLTNGGDPAFVHRVAERTLETLLGLEPEALPGSPAGIPPDLMGEWKAFTHRVQGRYRLTDLAPPGPLAALLGLTARPRLTDAGDGALAFEGIGKEPAFLYPDGEVGRYRVAYPLGNGTRAVIEERRDGTHLWASIMHLFRPRR